MTWTLKEAELLSPKTLNNEIVRAFSNQARRSGDNVAATMDVFPMLEMSAVSETFFRMHGGRRPMERAALNAESPMTAIESLKEDEYTVHTYKQKASPEKGVDTELNSEEEIYRLYQETANALRKDVKLSRDRLAWMGDRDTPGLIGMDGQTAHPEIQQASNVITPNTKYSDYQGSHPLRDFQLANYWIDEDGMDLDSLGDVSVYMPPSVLFDLTQNENLANRFSGVEVKGLTNDQVVGILPFDADNVNRVRIKQPRMNADGQLLDEQGNVAGSPSETVYDNVLEPYDPQAGTTRRNVVIMAPGMGTAFMPWYLDRLEEHASNAPPSGQFATDTSFGILSQTWTEHDPAVSYLKVAQEIGMSVRRGENITIIQDV